MADSATAKVSVQDTLNRIIVHGTYLAGIGVGDVIFRFAQAISRSGEKYVHDDATGEDKHLVCLNEKVSALLMQFLQRELSLDAVPDAIGYDPGQSKLLAGECEYTHVAGEVIRVLGISQKPTTFLSTDSANKAGEVHSGAAT